MASPGDVRRSAVGVKAPPSADGSEPIDWLLLSSEPVTTLTDALRGLAWYRRRWLIELL